VPPVSPPLKLAHYAAAARLACLAFVMGWGAHISAMSATLEDANLTSALQAGRAQRVIIQYKDSDATATENDQQRRQRRHGHKANVLAMLDASHFKAQRDFSELPMSSMTLINPAALTRLMASPEVEAIFQDKPLKAHLTEALPLIGQTPVANVMGRKGSGVAMAILDTGVNYTRAELGSCTAPGVPSSTCKVVAAYEAAPTDNALDSVGHGTEVAMTAAAVAPDARIVAVDVFDGNSAFTSDVLAGITWVISNRAAYNIGVINLSLGDGVEHTSACGASDPFYTAIRNARNTYGIIVVAAAGNEGYTSGISSPACVSATLAAGAVYDANVGTLGWNLNKYNSTSGTTSTVTCWDNTTAADLVTCFSDSSSLLDVWAPGAMITVGGQATAGTSIAAPFVTGAVAVLRAQFPSETATQIETRITSTGKPITDTRNGIVKPRLDLLAAQGAPSNDTFASASALSGSGGFVSSWNYNATAQAGEPAHAGQTASHSVWWTWTAPASGTLTLSTQGSAFDTVLAVYSGASVTALTSLAFNDNDTSSSQSALSMAVVAGQTYKIAIDGKSGATGALNLNWSRSDTPYLVDLSVVLSGPNTVAAGDLVSVNATVHNAGPQRASNVQLVLTLPSGLTLSSTPAGCTSTTSTLTCILGAITASSSVAIGVEFNAVSMGTQQVSATVSSAEPESASADNTGALSIDVQQLVLGGGATDNGDAPLPLWSLGGLAAALWQLQRRRMNNQPHA
jgi:uncharacterized repeat protein (TIGR01451 family)